MENYTKYLITALGISALKNVRVPESCDILIGLGDSKQSINDLIYFFGNDLMIVFLVLTIRTFSKTDKVFSIIVNAALFLAIGKTIDEVFANPYGYHFSELFFDAFIIMWSVVSYFKYRLKTTKNR